MYILTPQQFLAPMSRSLPATCVLLCHPTWVIVLEYRCGPLPGPLSHTGPPVPSPQAPDPTFPILLLVCLLLRLHCSAKMSQTGHFPRPYPLEGAIPLLTLQACTLPVLYLLLWWILPASRMSQSPNVYHWQYKKWSRQKLIWEWQWQWGYRCDTWLRGEIHKHCHSLDKKELVGEEVKNMADFTVDWNFSWITTKAVCVIGLEIAGIC